MNDRIQKLEDQASRYASKQTTDLDEWEFIFRNRFAELVWKEAYESGYDAGCSDTFEGGV
jgi:hypothetical protein